MPCSPEKLASNRRNAKLSTGPSASGREISRKNGLKHGLTGAGIVLPDEDLAEVEARIASFERDLKPANDVARFLARQAAVFSVRIERCQRQEAATVSRAMLRAAEGEAEDRAEDLADLVEALDTDPAHAGRDLRRSPEGIDWLIGAFDELKAGWLAPRAQLKYAEWFDRAERLGGRAPAASRFQQMVDQADHHRLSGDERRQFMTTALLARVEADLALLRAAREGLDLDAIAQERAGAATRAIFDPAHDATLSRRYEAAAIRDFFKSLKEIEKINRREEESDASLSRVEDCDDLASSCSDEPGSPEVPPGRPKSPEVPSAMAEEGPEAPPVCSSDPVAVADPARSAVLRE